MTSTKEELLAISKFEEELKAAASLVEDGVWDAYRLAFITNKQKLGSNGDTAHVAGLMAVYELGYARRADDE